MSDLRFSAAVTFGLEAVVKREAQALGFEDIKASDGSVTFKGDFKTLARANMWLRCADRIQIIMNSFKALTFEEIYQGVKEINWGDWIPKDGNFWVEGKSVKSKLSSVPACQSVAMKAVVEKMKEKYNVMHFDMTGAKYKIQISILKDYATITLDSTGASLHKRGYRSEQGTAPLKETLASALIQLSFWKKDRILLDPVCGSGTIPIEAAMIARNIAPGLSRKFDAESWEVINSGIWKDVRQEAYSAIDYDFMPEIYGSDIDKYCIRMAKNNAQNAGVDDCIHFDCKPFSEVRLKKPYGICICNPPYGERLSTIKEIEELYTQMGKTFNYDRTWSFYAITSYEDFEKCFKRNADKKRKLFNGNVKVDYYQYFGERPPKAE